MGKRTRTRCLMTGGYILKFGIVFPSKSCFSQCWWGDSIHLSVSHRVDWHQDHCRSSTKTTTTWRQQPNHGYHGQTFWYPATRITTTALFMAQLRHVRPRLSFSGTRNTDETAPPCSTPPFPSRLYGMRAGNCQRCTWLQVVDPIYYVNIYIYIFMAI